MPAELTSITSGGTEACAEADGFPSLEGTDLMINSGCLHRPDCRIACISAIGQPKPGFQGFTADKNVHRHIGSGLLFAVGYFEDLLIQTAEVVLIESLCPGIL